MIPHKVNNYPLLLLVTRWWSGPRGSCLACYCAIPAVLRSWGREHIRCQDRGKFSRLLHAAHVSKLRPNQRTSRGQHNKDCYVFSMSTHEAPWCWWHRSCLGSDYWLEHTGNTECSGLWLVTSAGWLVCTSQLGSTPGAECYGWPLPGVTPCDPSGTNQRPGHPGTWPITGLSLVRSPPPLGWSGTGRRLAWLWSRGGDQWVAGTRPGHTVVTHYRYWGDSDGQNCDQVTKHRSVFGSIRTGK